MKRLLVLAGGCLALSGCIDPVSDEDRAAGEAARAALEACYQAAGFTIGETSPNPNEGEARRMPGGDAWDIGSLRAPDGTWLDLYQWSEWTDDPDHAENTAAYQAQVFNEQAYPGYGPVRAVGRRAYVTYADQPYLNDALDACLMMP